MNRLYPIIRRRRVPLVLRDAPPVAVGNVEPVQVAAELGDTQPATTTIEHPMANPPLPAPVAGKAETSDAKAASKRKAR